MTTVPLLLRACQEQDTTKRLAWPGQSSQIGCIQPFDPVIDHNRTDRSYSVHYKCKVRQLCVCSQKYCGVRDGNRLLFRIYLRHRIILVETKHLNENTYEQHCEMKKEKKRKGQSDDAKSLPAREVCASPSRRVATRG